MNEIKVIGLTDCAKCKELRSKLESKNINYTFTDCDANSECAGLCDYLENITGEYKYPMVILIKPDKKEILYLSDVKNIAHMKDNYHLLQFYSLYSLSEHIIN